MCDGGPFHSGLQYLDGSASRDGSVHRFSYIIEMHDVYSVFLIIHTNHPISSALAKPTSPLFALFSLFALFALFALFVAAAALACVIVVPLRTRHMLRNESRNRLKRINSAIELSEASCIVCDHVQSIRLLSVSAFHSQNAIVPKDTQSIPSVSVPCQGHSYPQEAPVP